MQHAGRYTPIKHLGQATPAVTGYSNEVRTLTFGGVYDLFHDRAMDDAGPGLDTFLAELSFVDQPDKIPLASPVARVLVDAALSEPPQAPQ